MFRKPLLCLALSCLAAIPVIGDQHKEATAAAPALDPVAMEAMMKAMMPGENHKPLGRYVGDWTYTMKMWMAPGAPPTDSNGTMHAEWIMDGRYVRAVYKGDFMGMPFVGESTEGYDNVAKKYVGSWLDNVSTTLMWSTSTCDVGCNTITSTSDVIDPMSGQKLVSKSIISWSNDKSFKLEMFMIDGSANSMKTMELVATKK
jgi:Protein of unknown function (DUF1579)